MDYRLMDFDKFSLNEAKNVQASNLLETIKGIAGDKYGEIYIVPDFETFERPGEPKQNTTLVGTKAGPSFGVNFADGKFYSMDVWEKNAGGTPDKTVYADGNSFESVFDAVVNQGEANEAGDSPDEPLVLKIEGEDDEEEKKTTTKTTKKTATVKTKPTEKTEFDKEAAKAQTIPAVAKNPAKKGSSKLKTPYEFQDPDTIFEDLKIYTNMVIDGTQPSMLVTGMAGVGKTYNIVQEFKKAGLEKDKDFFHAKGKATAAGMYQVLYENNGKLILFDDMDSIFKDENAVNILKGALDSDEVREIAWLSSRPLKTPEGEVIPQKFDFTGRVIFITNLAQAQIDDAIKSRSFVIEVALSPEDMVKYIEGLFDVVMPYERVSTKRYALDAIKEAEAANPDVQINMRTFIKAVKIVKHVEDKETVDRMIIQQCSYK